MKLFVMFVCALLASGLMAQNIEYSGKCPASIYLENRQFGRNINLKVLPDNSKLVLLAGLLRQNGKIADAEKGPWLSDLIFLSPDGKKAAERQFPGLATVNKLAPEKGGAGYYLVSENRTGKADDSSRRLIVFDAGGNQVFEIPDLKGRLAVPAVAGDGIMIGGTEDGYSRNITLIRLAPPRGEKADRIFSVKAALLFKDNVPSGFVYLGGPNLDYIVSMGASVWRKSGKTRVRHWKIRNVGDEITNISMSGRTVLKISTVSRIIFVNIETGRRLASLFANDPALKQYRIGNWDTANYKNGKVVIAASNGETRYLLTMRPAAQGNATIAGVTKEAVHSSVSLPFAKGSFLSRKMGKTTGKYKFYGLKVDGGKFILFSY
ncbi:MAG: hypothetical protein GXO69_02185 [Acidobacteria bacterium]|nr:hypothetical protein [Acidobacteriota bacterium]